MVLSAMMKTLGMQEGLILSEPFQLPELRKGNIPRERWIFMLQNKTFPIVML